MDRQEKNGKNTDVLKRGYAFTEKALCAFMGFRESPQIYLKTSDIEIRKYLSPSGKESYFMLKEGTMLSPVMAFEIDENGYGIKRFY